MEEIEVGEYVRIKNKGIKRIDRIDNNKTVNKYLYFTGIEDFEGKEYKIIKKTEIVKHSKQSIELIKAGDFVNGYRVDEVRITCFGNSIFLNDYGIELQERDIKTILTKEQMEANQYVVK